MSFMTWINSRCDVRNIRDSVCSWRLGFLICVDYFILCLCLIVYALSSRPEVGGFRGCITFFLWNDTSSCLRWDQIPLRKRAKSYRFWKYLTHIFKSGNRCGLWAWLSASELNCFMPDYICVCGLIKRRVCVALGFGGGRGHVKHLNSDDLKHRMSEVRRKMDMKWIVDDIECCCNFIYVFLFWARSCKQEKPRWTWGWEISLQRARGVAPLYSGCSNFQLKRNVERETDRDAAAWGTQQTPFFTPNDLMGPSIRCLSDSELRLCCRLKHRHILYISLVWKMLRLSYVHKDWIRILHR